jgi:hypothetical protein
MFILLHCPPRGGVGNGGYLVWLTIPDQTDLLVDPGKAGRFEYSLPGRR